MNQEAPLWLIVTGPPAAGKTTFVIRLAQDLGIPLFEKDTIKDLLYETLGFGDKDWSRQVAPIAIDVLFFAANQLLQNGVSVATESNFYRQFNSERASELASKVDARIVQIHCSAPPQVLIERNSRRLAPPYLRPNHHVMPKEELLGKLASGTWEPLDVHSKVIHVDTSDSIQYANLLQTIHPDAQPCLKPSHS